MHTVRSRLVTALAGLAVWAALVAPNQAGRMSPWTFARIPLEGLILVVLALVLHPRARGTAAAVFGVVLGVLVILKILDIGFLAILDRPFDPLNDWVYVGPGVGVLGDSIGHRAAVASAVTAAVLGVVILTLLPLCVVRLMRLVARHHRFSIRAVTGLGVIWILCAVFGLQLSPGMPVASTSAADLALHEVSQVRADIRGRQTFAKEIGVDRFADTPDDRLLTGLRGKDVILAFVESYGRVAVQDSTFSPQVDAVLDAGTDRLRAAGFSSRSAFLTSPTFGAASWLAHSTLQSGLWVDSQQRYEQLLPNDRLTLTAAFGRAGWRTVFDVPANTEDWPEGSSFYRFDQLYDSRNVGYRGPKFSYAPMPDQYILSAYRRLELASADRAPVMGEIDLVSSHHPWTPLPHLVDWDDVGDGSVFAGMPEQGEPPEEAFRDPAQVRALYGRSIEYSLSSLISFVQAYPDPDLVLIVLGDHQPHSYVTGEHPGHDVPITVIAHDPAVMDAISGWGWQAGMNPGRNAPVWRMDTFRDRFLSAYGAPGEPATSVRADSHH
ncbi:MAG: sulfatase [Nocardioidaceae bacterium]|nr:sulfatase [Nocardioidaceae bacterium]